MGFGGTFYVCDFDSFKTRKDWYMTFRQMKVLANEGFEIGNHTKGHYGTYGGFLAMEDELFAHDGPRMTTVCWPLYDVDWKICPDLARLGYTFGRGGHERAYRPTVDNPFDAPSFTIRNGLPVEAFVKQARQACQGRVVVFCFHGVPDMEHPGVSLDPDVFKVQMQYLKDNHYKVIAMRRSGGIYRSGQSRQAAADRWGIQRCPGSVVLASEEKPCGAVPPGKQNPRSERKPPAEKPTQKLPAASES